MMYVYKSPAGFMRIAPNPNTGRWDLWIGDTVYGSYSSAVGAADDVYMHVTGCNGWDDLDGTIDAPTDVYEWEKRS